MSLQPESRPLLGVSEVIAHKSPEVLSNAGSGSHSVRLLSEVHTVGSSSRAHAPGQPSSSRHCPPRPWPGAPGSALLSQAVLHAGPVRIKPPPHCRAQCHVCVCASVCVLWPVWSHRLPWAQGGRPCEEATAGTAHWALATALPGPPCFWVVCSRIRAQHSSIRQPYSGWAHSGPFQ